MDTSVFIIPGYTNSGPNHWQTLWEAGDASMARLKVDDWDHPVCASWVAAIDAQTRSARKPVVAVAHSLGCLALVHWAAKHRLRLHGALLVAVPDPRGPAFPPHAEGFWPIPPVKLPYRSVVVCSRDDPYATPEFAKSCADEWGSTFVDIGLAGHINSASNLGDWPAGLRLLEELRTTTFLGQ
jgi:uncharacterized protein